MLILSKSLLPINNLSPIVGVSSAHKRNEIKSNSETELNKNWDKQRKRSSLKRIEKSVAKISPRRVSLNINGSFLKPLVPLNNRKFCLPSYHPFHNQAMEYIILPWKSLQ